MKVLHVYRTYFPDPPGGIEQAVRQICLSMQPHGVESTIFALSPQPQPAEIIFPEARVVRSRSWAAPASCDLGGLGSLLMFRQAAREADVVHYLFPWPFADVLHAVAPRKPSVLTYISDIVRQKYLSALYTPLMWRTLNSMDAIVSNAPGYAKGSPVLSQLEGSDKLRQIPLGIEESSYPKETDTQVLARLSLGSEPYILFLGADRYYKGLHTLLEACQHIRGRVVIAGVGTTEGKLPEQAKALGLSNLIFAGEVSEAEKVALLQHCRALVLPSHLRSEAYGMVLVEASMFARPMVTCEIGTGTSYINKHEETGFVVAPESADALAQALNKLLADSALADQLGLAARQRYATHFSGAALGRAYAELFREMQEHHH